ncbi:MAG: DUF1559 domain-containing protein [Planctomycetes bacterium]|nr:DUF1559 domain-containing protein [Planctomycetota bacterium]
MIRSRKRAGLTLIELLTLLGLFLFLVGFLIPAVFRVRVAAGRTQSINNLKQMALALHSVNDAQRALPPVVGEFPANSNTRGTLHFYLLPYIEQDPLYKLADGNVWNKGVYSQQVVTFLNPEDKTAPPNGLYEGWLATTSYAGNWMVFKLGGASIPRTFRDGTSNTLVFAERYQMCNGQPTGWGYASLYYWAPMFAYYSKARFQMTPSQEDCRPALAQATGRAGIQVALGDGSVRLLNDALSTLTWHLACDPADGMVLGNDF